MAKGRTDIYQIGIDPGNSNQKLPALEDMAEHFPDLASKFEIIQPLTGEVLKMKRLRRSWRTYKRSPYTLSAQPLHCCSGFRTVWKIF